MWQTAAILKTVKPPYLV